jgi:iron complex outermembrane receptor protein
MRINTLLFVLLIAMPAMAQNRGTVQGKVKTSDGQAAGFVNVYLKGTSLGTSTTAEGDFIIKQVPAGSYTLVASFVGLKEQSQAITIQEGQTLTVPDFTLEENSQQLSEIVVTDQRINALQSRQSDYVARIPLTNLENPQVYSSIGKELLQQQLVFSVDDAVKNAPGLQKMWEATGRGGDGGAYYNARGFILQSQLRNGIAGNVTSRIDAANLERIEVIKGPSATLFGSTLTSYGGLINRVTKKPYQTFGGEIAYSSGSFGFNRVSADVNAPLGKEKNVLFRLNTAYNYEGSFQDNGFEKSMVVAPSFSYQVTDRLTVSLDAEYYQGENTSKQIIFFYFPADQLKASNPRELGIDYNRSYSNSSISQVSRNANYFLQATYRISDRWTSQTNFTSTHSFSDGPYAYFYVIPDSLATGDTNLHGANYLVRADQSTANSEMNVREFQQNFFGEFNLANMKHRVVMGLDLFMQHSNQLFYGMEFDTIPKNGVTPAYTNYSRDKLNAALGNGSPWQYPYRYKTNTYSAYMSDVINITPALTALLAMRVDYFDNQGSFDQVSGKYSGAYTQTAWSPKAGVVYQPLKDQLAFFVNYQNGFTNKTGTDVNGDTFTPEQAYQFEGGMKVQALQGRVSATVSYYDIRVQDMVRADPQNPNFSIQDGTQLSRGTELEIIANPIDGLNLVGGFAYNESEFTKSDGDVQGRRPATAMSPVTANAWMSYQLQRGALRGAGLGFGLNHAGDNKILNSDYYGVFTLPAYTILSATAFYNHPKFRVGVKVDNLTDEQYWIGYTTMTPQKPRNITANLTIKL